MHEAKLGTQCSIIKNVIIRLPLPQHMPPHSGSQMTAVNVRLYYK